MDTTVPTSTVTLGIQEHPATVVVGKVFLTVSSMDSPPISIAPLEAEEPRTAHTTAVVVVDILVVLEVRLMDMVVEAVRI